MPYSTTNTTIGGLPPPPGVIPNFVNPYSRGWLIILTIVICLTLTTLLIGIRICTKFLITKSHGWEDYMSIIAWLGFVAYSIILLEALKYGFGVQQWNVTIQDARKFAQVTVSMVANAAQILYAPLVCITKLSILLQYQRIFLPARTGKLYYLTQSIIWFNLALYTSIMIVRICQCIPRSKIWEPSNPGHCIDINFTFIATACFNIFSDFSILILPLVSVWRLQLATRRKVAISALFLTGFFACVSSIMRLYERIRAVHSLDGTFDMLNLSLWAVAEIASGIICGCLPVVPKFFRHCEFIIKTRVLTYFQRGSPRRTLDSPLDVPNLKKPLGSWHNAPNLYLHRDNYVELNDYRGISTIVSGGTLAALSGASGLKCQKADEYDYEDVENANPGNQIRKTVRVEASD